MAGQVGHHGIGVVLGIQQDGGDRLACGEPPKGLLEDLYLAPGVRVRPKLVGDDQAKLLKCGQHRPVAFDAEVGHLGRDNGGIDQQGVGCPILVREHPLGNRRVDLRHPLEAASASHPLESVPNGGGGGESWQVERLPEGLVLPYLSDILNGLTPAVEGQGESGVTYWLVAKPRQVLIHQCFDPQGVQEFGRECQATVGGDAFLGSFQLERQHGLSYHALTPPVVDWFHLTGEDCPSPKPLTLEGFSHF